MTTDRLLEKMRERLERSKPAQMVVTLASGEVVNTDPVGAGDIVRNHGQDIVGVKTDRPEYQAAAAIMGVIAHPAPNRRIEDYE